MCKYIPFFFSVTTWKFDSETDTKINPETYNTDLHQRMLSRTKLTTTGGGRPRGGIINQTDGQNATFFLKLSIFVYCCDWFTILVNTNHNQHSFTFEKHLLEDCETRHAPVTDTLTCKSLSLFQTNFWLFLWADTLHAWYSVLVKAKAASLSKGHLYEEMSTWTGTFRRALRQWPGDMEATWRGMEPPAFKSPYACANDQRAKDSNEHWF